VTGRRVLVTGVGGAVGAALCRRLTGLDPADLCLLDHDAAALDRLRLEIGGTGRPAPERAARVSPFRAPVKTDHRTKINA
jgi:FlaA1/EpsC-like NDP-sugar epimerase